MTIRDLYPDIKPSLNLDFANTKSLDPRIDFDRSTSGTYYDGQTFAKAEENLLKYSEKFDNAVWNKKDVTVSSNATTAPDGSNNAYSLTSGRDGFCALTQNVPLTKGLKYTISVYAKADTTNFFVINPDGVNAFDSNSFIIYDLSNGSVSFLGDSRLDGTITDIGNGWYRLTYTDQTVNSDSSDSIRLHPSSSSGSLIFSAGDSVFIWGAQIEQRDQVTAYTPTTDQPITNYMPVLQTAGPDEPRFDHDPFTGESKGLLIEEQRTNQLLDSEELNTGNWVRTRINVDADATTAPDGSVTGNKLVIQDGVNGYVLQDSPMTSGLDYTMSFYAKAAEYGYVQIAPSSGFTNTKRNFNLIAGTVEEGSFTARIEEAGNGWYRVSLTATADETRNGRMIIAPAENSTMARLAQQGDGYSGIFIWGVQFEEGSFPTSYIKTEGSQVTRVADSASVTAGAVGTQLIEDADGNWTTTETGSSSDTITITSSQRILQYPRSLTTDQIDALTKD